jgi:hypothetical protein
MSNYYNDLKDLGKGAATVAEQTIVDMGQIEAAPVAGAVGLGDGVVAAARGAAGIQNAVAGDVGRFVHAGSKAVGAPAFVEEAIDVVAGTVGEMVAAPVAGAVALGKGVAAGARGFNQAENTVGHGVRAGLKAVGAAAAAEGKPGVVAEDSGGLSLARRMTMGPIP